MGLNNRIGGAVDVYAPCIMEETLEKTIRQEIKIKKDDSIRDNKRKNTWNLERGDRGSQKKPFKEFKKTEFSSSETREVKNTSHDNKNNKNNEKKGPPGGCYNCGGEHYMKQCPVKPNNHQSQRPLLPQQQQAFQQRIHATLDNRQAEQQIGPIETPSKIYGNPVSILIDTRASECFISPKLLSRFPKRSSFMAKPWIVCYIPIFDPI